MNLDASVSIRDRIDDLYRSDSRRVFASLVRLLNDFDLADDAMHEAFAAAVEVWQRDGVPANPRAWLISTGKFKAINALHRQRRLKALQPEIASRVDELAEENAARAATEIEDDRLRLIFTCCHPAIDPKLLQVPLTLREVCGLTTEEIAHAFRLPRQRWPSESYAARRRFVMNKFPMSFRIWGTCPNGWTRYFPPSIWCLTKDMRDSAGRVRSYGLISLTAEAIRLGRLLLELLPDPETKGLLALMLLHESRGQARVSKDGEIIVLEEQDRSRWDQNMISEGKALVEQALRSGRIGAYTLQAAISAVHAEAGTAVQTDWNRIVALYSVLQRIDLSPVVELNRAVAVAMRDGPAAGLVLIDAILKRGDLVDYHLAHAARAELCRRSGKMSDAKNSYERALSLARQEPERRFLTRRLSEI